MQLTGEIGTGKTMMLDALVLGLDARTKVARLSHTTISEDELFELMISELGLAPRSGRKLERLAQIQEFLDEWTAAGRNAVLVVDEAQNLSLPVLEEIRLLSNLRSQGQCSLQIVLAGQPEFRTRLDQDDLRQLKQRIGIRYHLTPLSARETGEYIAHRLNVAGADGLTVFDKSAIEAIYAYAGGVPRMINVLCDRALVAGYGANRRRIGKALIVETVEEIEGAELGPEHVVAMNEPVKVEGSADAAAGETVEADAVLVMSADRGSREDTSQKGRGGRGMEKRTGTRHSRSAGSHVVGASVEHGRAPAWLLPVLVVVAALVVVAVSGVRTGWWRSLTDSGADIQTSQPSLQGLPDESVAGPDDGSETDVAGDGTVEGAAVGIAEGTVDEATAGEPEVAGDAEHPAGTEPDSDEVPVAVDAGSVPVVVDEADSQAEGVVDTDAAIGEDHPAWVRTLIAGPGGPYRAVALSSRQADAAAEAASLLVEQGTSAEVIPAEVADKGLWYRVIVTGGYPDLESAREAVEELKHLGYSDAWVFKE